MRIQVKLLLCSSSPPAGRYRFRRHVPWYCENPHLFVSVGRVGRLKSHEQNKFKQMALRHFSPAYDRFAGAGGTGGSFQVKKARRETTSSHLELIDNKQQDAWGRDSGVLLVGHSMRMHGIGIIIGCACAYANACGQHMQQLLQCRHWK